MITIIKNPSMKCHIKRQLKCPFCTARFCDSTISGGKTVITQNENVPPGGALLLKCQICGNELAVFIRKQ